MNNNNTKNKQEKLSKIQLLKTHCIVENHKQDNKNNDDNLISQHDWKAWHAIILINKSTLKQVYWNCSHIIA